MFDIGWTELLIIGVVALIVIGPKDLPEMFRTLGRFTAKMRAMAREFQRAMETAANESGVKDVARDLKAATSPQSMGLNAMKDAAAKFEKWDPLKPKPEVKPPVAAPAAAEAAKPAMPGPATQALAERQAERKAIAAEAAAKLRAVGQPDGQPANPAATPKPARTARKPAAATPAKPRKPKTPKAEA